MGDWGSGHHGNHVSTPMETAQAPACADRGHVTTLGLSVVDVIVKEPG